MPEMIEVRYQHLGQIQGFKKLPRIRVAIEIGCGHWLSTRSRRKKAFASADA